jgi:hypothetical protein
MPQSLRQVVGTNARNVVLMVLLLKNIFKNLETLYQELK